MKLSESEKKIIDVEIEKSRLNREKSMLVLNKSMFLYFTFLFIGVLGFINGYLNRNFLNLLILMGLGVLAVGTVPYVKTMYSEDKNLTMIIQELRGAKNVK
ncbi:MAG: hypothetical protein KJ709_06885 [Nanoarchaeota archaeon]|nr:hypothetical protein [Nanoarchaeota archaeon]